MPRHLRRHPQPWTKEQAVIIRKMAYIADLAIAVACRSIPPDRRGEFFEDLAFVSHIRDEANSVITNRKIPWRPAEQTS